MNINYTLPSGKKATISIESKLFRGNGKLYTEVRAEIEGGATQVGDPTRPASLPAWAVSAIGRLPLTAEVDAQVAAAIAEIDAANADHNAAAEAHLATSPTPNQPHKMNANKLTAKTARVPAPYRIGRNGTGWMEAPRPSKVPGYVSVLLTATGKRGQDVWSERRDVTLAQAAALI